MKSDIKEVLKALETGRINADEAFERLKIGPFEDLGYAKLDLHRRVRQGSAEVIYGEGKTAEQIIGIVDAMVENLNRTGLDA